MRVSLSLTILFLLQQLAFAQQIAPDSTHINEPLKFKLAAVIIPAGLLTYGIIGVKNEQIKSWNQDIRNEFNPNRKISNIDDIIVISPIAAVYGLDVLGVKAKNNFVNRTVVLATASTFVISAVVLTKNNVNARRPVGKSKASFPSGHTAMAFMSAEFLHQEYKHHSPWYSVAGYSIAGFTGFMRLYNDKHWLSEVAAGAAIGILGTKMAYWLQPTIQNAIFKQSNNERDKHYKILIAPSYTGSEMVLAASWTF
jgi:membrane-associated phospholipid phosphatase